MYALRGKEDEGVLFHSMALTNPRLTVAKDACQVGRTLEERIIGKTEWRQDRSQTDSKASLDVIDECSCRRTGGADGLENVVSPSNADSPTTIATLSQTSPCA